MSTQTISDNLELLNLLGSGSFGEVYMATNSKGKIFAAKVEDKKHSTRLVDEYNIYKNLRKNGVVSGIPKTYHFVKSADYNILTMELLGKSIDEIFDMYDQRFDIGTTLKIGHKITCLLEMIHDAGFIHRDIKPNNFMTGYGNKDNKLYIMDFGLSKRYLTKSGKHMPYTSERSLVGTARYASINVHMGIEPTRRDDLESVGYMLVYFLVGKLPWQGLQKNQPNKKKSDKKAQTQLIGEVKQQTDLNVLCRDTPECFKQYIEYAKTLGFDERPDYDYLKQLFIDDAKKYGVTMEYIWNIPEYVKN